MPDLVHATTENNFDKNVKQFSLIAAIDLILNPTYGDAYLAMKALSQGVERNDNDAFVTLHITANQEFDMHVRNFFH